MNTGRGKCFERDRVTTKFTCIFEGVKGNGEFVTFAFPSILKGRALELYVHDRRIRLVHSGIQAVCQNLVFPSPSTLTYLTQYHNIIYNIISPGGVQCSGVSAPPSTPPSWNPPAPYTPTPGAGSHPTGPLRLELQTRFLDIANVAKFTIFSNAFIV